MNTDRRDIYQKILRTIVQIIVLEGEEIISLGTGFVFLSDGSILTAAHVVAGGFPVKKGEVDQTSRKVFAYYSHGRGFQSLLPVICPIELKVEGLSPLQLDIALLKPRDTGESDVDHLKASIVPPVLGDEMIFAGYSDEVEFPFLIDRHITPATSGLDVLQRNLSTGLKNRLAGPIIKRGTVGNVIQGIGEQDGRKVISQTAFYLDNQIHSGASGGPICAQDGSVRGIIAKRMMTKIDTEERAIDVPSGSTLGLGLDVLSTLVKNDPSSKT